MASQPGQPQDYFPSVISFSPVTSSYFPHAGQPARQSLAVDALILDKSHLNQYEPMQKRNKCLQPLHVTSGFCPYIPCIALIRLGNNGSSFSCSDCHSGKQAHGLLTLAIQTSLEIEFLTCRKFSILCAARLSAHSCPCLSNQANCCAAVACRSARIEGVTIGFGCRLVCPVIVHLVRERIVAMLDPLGEGTHCAGGVATIG